MKGEFSIEPANGWAPGDRAYCLRGSRSTYPSIEKGKVYQVTCVIDMAGRVERGLWIEGVSPPEGYAAFSSARFVKLQQGIRSLESIDRHSSPSWTEAYHASTRNPGTPTHD